jgi:hypothetical protein
MPPRGGGCRINSLRAAATAGLRSCLEAVERGWAEQHGAMPPVASSPHLLPQPMETFCTGSYDDHFCAFDPTEFRSHSQRDCAWQERIPVA